MRLDTSEFGKAYDGIAERYWMRMYGGALTADDDERRLAEALGRCAQEGLRRVVLFGAGSFLASAGAALREPGVEVLAIADDNPTAIGTKRWGFDVVSVVDAAAFGADAVVLCTRERSGELRQRAGVFERAGAVVIDPNERSRGQVEGELPSARRA
jgi:hypothetical protein